MRATLARIPRSIVLVLIGAFLATAPAAYAFSKVVVQAPTNAPDFEPVAVNHTGDTLLTDQDNQRTVQVTNGTDQILCVSVDAVTPFDCASATITCTGGSNHTQILAGGTKSWLIGKSVDLCGKLAGAVTNSGIVTVEELVQ